MENQRIDRVVFNIQLCVVLFLLLLTSSVSGRHDDWDGVVVTQSDYQALQSIKQSLIDPIGALRSWNMTGVGACSGSWAGIKCVKGQVIAIQLPWKGLGGRISEKIGQLQALRKLSLHDNALAGPIPVSLGFLTNLRGVYLFNNRLSGSIPASLGNCLLLQTLDLSNNALSGSIPPSLANSTRLIRFNVSFNSLTGSIPESLTRSPPLAILALDHNNISGRIPDSWSGSAGLRVLNLDHNLLSGPIPPSFKNLILLEKLSLSGNVIQGAIPTEIGNLSRIQELDFSHNNLSGEIPISLANLSNLTSFNVSYNNLSGSVPSRLSEKFNSSAFVGNIQLCGFSGSSPCPSATNGSIAPAPASSEPLTHRKRKLSTKDIILIAAGILLGFLLLICCLLLCCLIRKKKAASKNGKSSKSMAVSEKAISSGVEIESGGDTGGKLVHFDGPFVFTADDLLCATAEIMGKSSYGTAYKATLEDGNQVAVKRLREKTTKGQREFESEVAALGRIRHPNLLALRAYYLGPKGEKLLVFDYMHKGSLASFLHGKLISLEFLFCNCFADLNLTTVQLEDPKLRSAGERG